MPTFNQFDVVVVPFPYTDCTTLKRRPALVLSDPNDFNNRIGQSVMAMITSAKHSNWPLDIEITDLDSAGLPAPSLVRMKLFTLDHRLIIRSCGTLSDSDQRQAQNTLSRLFNST
ncbi:type II toxin-antitoxin system PemK/MazF family toxin [Seongchinamella unica]|uniref:Type II toxin-antitoxin system PemK/MazF family toxin n=1 Tax=Seongchinamella unica TaxID=2547392 RepID=A0A4V2ZWU5_9GAMM|nr:type II toxin-antitoxin system PemK/MazF family toxin [Seongchinamella unica]TDG11632.1 type II toxin-antitoxin system PemK/MazF family toxin [Seongchinamella unica]